MSVFGRVVSGRRLLLDIYPSAALLRRPLNADPDFGYPGSLDAAVGGLKHCDGDPTPEIAVCTVVGLLPLGDKKTGQVFQYGLLLGTNNSVH